MPLWVRSMAALIRHRPWTASERRAAAQRARMDHRRRRTGTMLAPAVSAVLRVPGLSQEEEDMARFVKSKGKKLIKGPVGGPAGVRVMAGGQGPQAAAPRTTRPARSSTAGYKARMGKP